MNLHPRSVWLGFCLEHAKRFLNDELIVLKPHERPRTEAAPERPTTSPTEEPMCPSDASTPAGRS